MPLSDEAVIEAFLRFERQIDSLRTSASTLVVRHWDVLESFDEADLAAFVKAATPDLTAVKAASANVSSAFYSTMLEVAPRALDLEAIATPAPDGPFLALWHALNEGRPYEQAVAAGRSRVESLAFDTVQSTSRRVGDQLGEDALVIGWHRVVSVGACPWCQTIAGQLYHTAESADFGHDRCDCTAIPVTGARDPARALNRQRIGR